MRDRRDDRHEARLARLLGPAFLLTFGLAVLLLLVAIDRPHWFDRESAPDGVATTALTAGPAAAS